MITDKRIVKTRTNIKNAFKKLMLDNDISKITVSQISEKAGINRSTFYLHYSDVDSVVKDIEKDIIAAISSCVDKFDIEKIYETTYELFINLTTILNERTDTKKYILFSTSSSYVTGRLKEIIEEKLAEALTEKYNFVTNEIIYPLTFAAAGIVDTYVKWAHAADENTSLENLIREVSEIVTPIIEELKNKRS